MLARSGALSQCIGSLRVRASGGDVPLLFANLFEILRDFKLGHDVEVLNCYGDARFLDEYFGDHDHLRPLGEGTRLLSTLIAERLR